MPGETKSRRRSDLVHSAGLMLQPGNTNSSGNFLHGQKELRASPTLTRRQPPRQHPEKGSIFSSCIPAGGNRRLHRRSGSSTTQRVKIPKLPRSADSYAPHRLRVGAPEVT